ncbi:AIPR family protein [uncultured Lacinutrix sp.]|uniref:AIPR family protein n=1 Tax=uncultured Lacinutrix sp. TaxID=574032 RepID=UPI002623DAB0|nr:AIPR family protein [uncultured Lacinutrix sp.]
MKDVILKLNHANSLQTSNEGLKINKFISSISPLTFIKLLKEADNKVNPRIATVNKITRSIHETLETSPELFWYKSKGILLATETCELLDRNRVRVSLSNMDYEGIMDGGHNTFAIAIYLIEKLFDKKIKKWEDSKNFWDENYDEIIKRFEERKEEFSFSIPVEIITPNDEDGAVEEFYDFISEICSARNNNVQLKETAKGNQVGYYDYLKEILDDEFDIIWKTGDAGKIKSEDVISLASLSLIFMKNRGLLPKDIKSLNKISIYSQKSKCVDFFNSVMSHEDISTEDKGKHVLDSNSIKSALNLTKDILIFFDRMFIEFPNLYHNATPGKFGRITAVDNKKKGRVPYFTTDKMADYNYSYGFFYPLISGITSLMDYDDRNEEVYWKTNPKNLDLKRLELTQYVNIIKLVNFDPQKIGKGDVFYKEAESVFEKVLN